MNEEMQGVENMTRQRAAAEVIELGEMLFDTAIDAAAQRATGGEESDAALIEEMRAVANEFFIALRLLLEAGQTEREAGKRNL
jgi:hypothetical protein